MQTNNNNNFVKIGVLLTTLLLTGIHISICDEREKESLSFNITTTWDNVTVTDKEFVTVTFSSIRPPGPNETGLVINISAPFYDDPMPKADPGRVDQLRGFEVVEIFFLGEMQYYLELKFAPGGHYSAFSLAGVRNVIDSELLIKDYHASINRTTERWTGRAVIPTEYFPPLVDAFNAYAIHGKNTTNTTRQYMALFPVPLGSADEPDFHDLESFQEIDLGNFITIRNMTIEVESMDGSGGAGILFTSFVLQSALSFVPFLL